MKKFLFLLISFLTAFNVQAQIKLNTDGSVNLYYGGTGYVQNKVTIGNPTSSSSYSNAWLYTKAKAQSSGSLVAIVGDACDNSYGTSTPNIGVWGITGGTASGYNCGVAGSVGNSYGVGVYGTSGSSLGYVGYGCYAGYFDGPTYVAGTITATQVLTSSDRTIKENIIPLHEEEGFGATLEKLSSINVVSYNYKKQDTGNGAAEPQRRLGETEQKQHFGVIAQELQEIYPNLVEKGQDGLLSVNYVELVPLLIQSIKELKAEVSALSGKGEEIQAKAMTGSHQASVSTNRLFQNNPNPFRENTVIRFSLAADATDAAICIFDMTGKQLKRIPVNNHQEAVTVNGQELGAGMYLYTLLVDGQEVDTKRMILSK